MILDDMKSNLSTSFANNKINYFRGKIKKIIEVEL